MSEPEENQKPEDSEHKPASHDDDNGHGRDEGGHHGGGGGHGGHGGHEGGHGPIIKKIKKVHKGGHHGGSWKIAYADFVTAMMAFFLLMWLLSLLNKYQLQGISEYFRKPLKEAFTKQDMIKPKDTTKPDSLGETAFTKKGSKTNNPNTADKNIGMQDGSQKENKKPTAGAADITEAGKKKGQAAADAAAIKAQQEKEKQQKEMQDMKSKLEKDMEKNPQTAEYKNLINFKITSEGLKIELRDLENQPMFSEGKADFFRYSKEIVGWLSKELNNYPNRVVIIGHTDSKPYNDASGKYSNWELSADRANATRRELVANGMQGDKIIRVIGMGDTKLLKEDGEDPANRRIEIVVLTKDEADRIMRQ